MLRKDKNGVMKLSTSDYRRAHPIDLEKAAQLYELHPVIKQCGQWAVTTYGMECLVAYYYIQKERLFEGEPNHGWAVHMVGRRFGAIPVNMRDFLRCLAAARQYHFPGKYGERIVEVPKEVPIHHYHKIEVPAVKRCKAKQQRSAIGDRLRFKILKRDGYRCQLCGRGAADDVVLEVDHKVADAKGGPTKEHNLWVLCKRCNRGKSTEDL